MFVDRSTINEARDFLSVVKPADELSEQILDLSSSIKAREEAIHMLESKFN
jgi:hypothetical protein